MVVSVLTSAEKCSSQRSRLTYLSYRSPCCVRTSGSFWITSRDTSVGLDRGRWVILSTASTFESHPKLGPWILRHEIEGPLTNLQDEEVSIAHLQWITVRPVRLLVVYVDHGLR